MGIDSEDGRSEFCVTNLQLANGFYELLTSLGYKVNKKIGKAIFNGKEFIRYRFSFVSHEDIFKLPYKLSRIKPKGKQYLRTKRRYILDIKEVTSVPVKCIKVDSSSNYF